MLEVKINAGDVEVKVEGNMPTIMSDITMLCRSIYKRFDDTSKKDFDFGLEKIVEEKLYAKTEEELLEMNKKMFVKLMKRLLNEEDFLKDILK